ncbi:glutamyl-tRNA reductase [Mycetocola tolaasinivorans]|uniref:Glutamyl-tRNA reductase n=1 Tax=Mycetocola tolaasinivorans TaxID=76635 RepID=A0A3L7A9T7_9MICO|nr:glutamyl-tRNA reductase [Mycetocola tolaasinivorans]RLP76795.1 glutamyl-tRNA reductase [Mycetocola tolaasinivorans]
MLICLTASHKNSSFDLLERLSAAEGRLERALLDANPDITGAVIINTCNRFEAYLELGTDGTPPEARTALTEAAASSAQIATDELVDTWDLHVGEEAARHLFAVSSGLESVVVGEGEIAGQVRRALDFARAEDTTTSDLERLFQRASQTSRAVKNKTPLGRAGRSLVRLALDLSESRIHDWSTLRVLLIGTGAYAGASLAALRDRGVTNVAVYSPSGRAARFAQGHDIEAVAAADFAAAVAEASLIVTCTTASDFVLDADIVTTGRRLVLTNPPQLDHEDAPGCPITAPARQLVIDLGLPRNVNPDVVSAGNIELLDLETIRLHAPLEEVQATEHARVLVNRAAKKFIQVTSEQGLDPAVVAMRRHAHEILEEEVARVAPRDPDGVAERALRHLMGRMLHVPTVRARELARAGEHDRYLEALETLLGLAVPDATVEHAESDTEGAARQAS